MSLVFKLLLEETEVIYNSSPLRLFAVALEANLYTLREIMLGLGTMCRIRTLISFS